jgi:ribulose kinase
MAVRYYPFYKTTQIMACKKKETTKPISENQKVYKKLFAKYLRLHDYFGGGGIIS